MRTWTSPTALLLYLLVVAHGALTWTYRGVRPELEIIAPPPGAQVRTVLAFGDEQLLYRMWALGLQNAGDTGGRTTAMRDYNYDYVLGWLNALSALDPHAEYHLLLAARYFSYTPNKNDLRRLVDFIAADVGRAPDKKWYWLTQAVIIAETKIGDLPLALDLARKLAAYDLPGGPGAPRMLPAILLEKVGRLAEAESAMEEVRTRWWNDLTEDERRYLEYFIQRLHAGDK